MSVTLSVVSPDALERYAEVSIAYRVETRYLIEEDGTFIEEALEAPYEKDYDRYGGPTSWRRWDLSAWRFQIAEDEGRLVGASAVAMKTPGLDLLEGQDDRAVLWDLRVAPAARRQGLGSCLVRDAAAFARGWGMATLQVETQDRNVPACRFYAALGFRLEAVRPHAYEEPDLRHEAMLLWNLHL